MDRRQALGALLAAGLLLGGRGIRKLLLLGPDGRWRDPGFLDGLLPELEPPPPIEPEPPSGPIDVNAASADTLRFLPGIGPALASRIVAERESGGPFADAADLQRVKGIGPRLAAKLAGRIAFTGEAEAAGD